MKKRIIIIISSICIAIAFAIITYILSYPVKLNASAVDNTVSQFLSQGHSIPRDVEFLGASVGIDDNEYFLISVDEQFGYVCFEKGPIGRHRIHNVSYGGGTFRSGIIDSNSKKYLLFAGLDSGNLIDKIVVEIQGSVYELNPGNHRPFFTYTEIDSRTTESYIDLDKITFFDKDNAVITHHYELGGGSFQ